MMMANGHELWAQAATDESDRLHATLGELVTGGIVDTIQHVGATSISGLPAHACIDLALIVWPYPLEAGARSKLELLGYTFREQLSNPDEQRFDHTSGKFRLYISEPGSDVGLRHLVLRDYLRHNEDARTRYAARKQAWLETGRGDATQPDAKNALFDELSKSAETWWIAHHGFGPVEEVVTELSGYARPWYISSGWAMDLYLGRVTRLHHDIDVVVDRDDQLVLRKYLGERGWQFVTPLDGKLEPWPPHMRIEMPRHQIHAHRGDEMIDFLLTDLAHGIWRFRRNPTIVCAGERAFLRTDAGIPYLAPELCLLYKSKYTGNVGNSGKNHLDFEAVHRELKPAARAWLRWALTATDPAHPWIELLV